MKYNRFNIVDRKSVDGGDKGLSLCEVVESTYVTY